MVKQKIQNHEIEFQTTVSAFIDADQARRWGLVNTVTPDPLAQALTWAREAAA